MVWMLSARERIRVRSAGRKIDSRISVKSKIPLDGEGRIGLPTSLLG
jgi:hypothetical protein